MQSGLKVPEVPLLRLSCRPWLKLMQSVVGSWMNFSCCGCSNCVPPYCGGVGERFFHYKLIPNFYNIRVHTHHFTTIFPILQNDFRLISFFVFDVCIWIDRSSSGFCISLRVTIYFSIWPLASYHWVLCSQRCMIFSLVDFSCALFRYSNFYFVQV